MWKVLVVSIVLLISNRQVQSRVLPKEGSTLNYRLIGFSYGAGQPVGDYEIEIAMGSYYSFDSFKKNITVRLPYKNTKIIGEVPFFGKSYTWCVANLQKKGTKTELHHFSTGSVKNIDTSAVRLRVLKKAEKYKDAYVFLDGTRALYDMDGNAVWYLPDVDGAHIDKPILRDMKLSTAGTITFLFEELNAYEVNYNGEVLWKAPNTGNVSGYTSEMYHHEFTRLANGHYMILGNEYDRWNMKMPSATDSSFVIFHDGTRMADSSARRYPKLPFGTVIEYDDKGNVVWTWKSSGYFRNSDIYYHKDRANRPDIAMHENAFYFDENDSILYVSFRNISRIVKIKYPEGKVLDTYGETYKPDVPETGNGLFCRQHSIRRSAKGYLYLYNNNSCTRGQALPEILKLSEPAVENGGLKKIWEYKCTIEGVDTTGKRYAQFPVGGNVVELPDGSLFANMSTVYSKVFILSEDKEILWSAIPENWNPVDKRWDMVYDYRASIINSRQALEQLIWNAEKK